MSTSVSAPTPIASPLRWAGGKRWLIPTIVGLLRGTEISAYHEPFLGGASVFLGLPAFTHAYLSDANAELIEAFEVIRDRPAALANLAGAQPDGGRDHQGERDHGDDDRARDHHAEHYSQNGTGTT